MLEIKQELAQQIVEAVKEICGQDVNFIDTNGIIFASTQKLRIGNYHEIGSCVAKTGTHISVTEDNSFLVHSRESISLFTIIKNCLPLSVLVENLM